MKRELYIVAYDVRSPRRLARVRKALRAWSNQGQKSVFECFLTPGERVRLTQELRELLDLAVDRAFVLRLRPNATLWCLGRARPPREVSFLLIGGGGDA